MSRSLKLLACALASVGLLASAAACGDSGGSPTNPTATSEHPATDTTPAATATSAAATSASPFATDFSGPNESGHAPIFWRTADDFATLRAGQPYKMLLRITNGYAEPTLTVNGVCTNCRTPNEPPTAALTGAMVTPVGADAPGSYYPVNVLLPRSGHWELTVQAGADQVIIPVDAKAAQ